jgi:acyl carrier protein
VSTPSEAELRAIVLEALRQVAPEADLDHLDPAADLREELEIDSMDVLNLAIAIYERTGVEIPEQDYARLRSLADGVAYLRRRMGLASP